MFDFSKFCIHPKKNYKVKYCYVMIFLIVKNNKIEYVVIIITDSYIHMADLMPKFNENKL